MKKFSNKILIITLVVLVAIFVLSRVFRSPGLESNLRKELVALDTATVTEVRIKPKGQGSEVKLVRDGKNWKVTANGKQANAEAGTVESMLGVVMNLNAQRLISRKQEKWETFQVDEQSTHVSIYSGEKKLADFRVGKTGFNQSQPGAGGGFNGGYTYVRLDNEDEVYSTEGFLASHFGRDFNGWRNKAFLRIKKDEVTRLTFNYPDSGFVVEKKDSVWHIQSTLIDNSKIDAYLNKLQFKNVNEFEDDFTPPASAPVSIQINGSAGNLATVQAWPKTEEEWVLASALQSGVYFRGKKSGVVKDIFVGQSSFE